MKINKTYEDVMNEINATGILIRKTIIWKSPVSKGLEYRVAYFKENYEANIWASDMESKYEKLGLEYHIYTHYVNLLSVVTEVM